VRAKSCRFCGWAREYESDKLSRILGVYQQQALEVLGPTRGDLLLDVGCGSGAAVRNAAGTVDAAVGADACPRMIERARRLGADLRRAHFLVATADTLPFADRAFTAVLCTSVLRHVRDRAVAAREMARVLVPGGRIVVGDFVQDLSCNRGRAARRRAREAALASLPCPDLVVGPHLVCSTVLGPYLITHATKACRPSAIQFDVAADAAAHDRRPMMEIERSRLEEILREHGSKQTALSVAQLLPERIDTHRDQQLIQQCGIDTNVLETMVARTDI
jgi:ubiquinone/menaquinone biosynthesis C-methylase UbiE